MSIDRAGVVDPLQRVRRAGRLTAAALGALGLALGMLAAGAANAHYRSRIGLVATLRTAHVVAAHDHRLTVVLSDRRRATVELAGHFPAGSAVQVGVTPTGRIVPAPAVRMTSSAAAGHEAAVLTYDSLGFALGGAVLGLLGGRRWQWRRLCRAYEAHRPAPGG